MKVLNFLLFLLNMLLCGVIFGYLHHTFPEVQCLDKLMVLCLICVALFYLHLHHNIKEHDLDEY